VVSLKIAREGRDKGQGLVLPSRRHHGRCSTTRQSHVGQQVDAQVQSTLQYWRG